MRRWTSVLLIALAALVASAASAKNPQPPPPDGAWELRHTRATYSGPPMPVRSVLTKIMENRVDFKPLCTQTQCAASVTIRRPPRGDRVTFTLFSKDGGPFIGSKTMTSSLRCGGRPLKTTLKMTVVTGKRLDELVLSGTTEARAVNPGRCALFRGKARGVRKVWFVGASANG